MRVLPFSRYFPAYHPRKGEPTHFVEKIWNSMNVTVRGVEFFYPGDEHIINCNKNIPYHTLSEFVKSLNNRKDLQPKLHTIRSGNRWKVGDMFSPRVWSGQPYRSKQIEFAPPMEVKAVYPFLLTEYEYILNGKIVKNDLLKTIATNDGLSAYDFEAWFRWPQEFNGQVICWGDVKY